MEVFVPYKVSNNFQGIVFFTELYWKTKKCFKDEVVLNFKETKVFESNMFAVLGCLVAGLERKGNKVRFIEMQESILNLFNTKKLIKGGAKKNVWKSLIKCQHFGSASEDDLSAYLEEKIFPDRPEINTNPQLKMAIQLCVAEIFRNAFVHGACRELFISHFFSVYNKKLFITVVNQGKSIKDTARAGSNSSVGAIKWAVENGTTSRTSEHNGIGLHTIRQFVQQNQGKIQIMSGDAVWKQVKHRTFSKNYEKAFPGTIVTLEFNI
jgi:hypothetical protein